MGKKLVSLISHGLGDWYEPLRYMSDFVEKNGYTEHHLYVDSIYYVDRDKYKAQRIMGNDLLNWLSSNCLLTDINFVPPQSFGSGDLYGIEDRVTGPEFAKIEKDFLFYRGEALKAYFKDEVLSKVDSDTDFIYWFNKHNYMWKDGVNVPIDLTKYTPKQIDISKSNRYAVVHIRKRGRFINDMFYKQLIDYLEKHDIKTFLIGDKEEFLFVPVGVENSVQNTIVDMRVIPVTTSDIFNLIEKCHLFIGNNSMFTCHALANKVNTISCTAESNGKKESFFTDTQLSNSNAHFFNGDENHMDDIISLVHKYFVG